MAKGMGKWKVSCCQINPLPDDKILDRSKLKQSADDNFKFHENSRKLFKQVENTVGKGEIARYEHFSFSNSVFKRFVSQGHQEVSLCGNGLNNFRVVHGNKIPGWLNGQTW